MARGGPPGWTRRDCSFDHLVVAAMQSGYGTEMVYKGIASWERADELRRGIYRCASHRGISAEAGPSRLTDPPAMGISKTGRTYTLRYRVWTKRAARRSHLDRYGADRTAWPYDPRRPSTDEEKAAHAAKDETGRPVRH